LITITEVQHFKHKISCIDWSLGGTMVAITAKKLYLYAIAFRAGSIVLTKFGGLRGQVNQDFHGCRFQNETTLFVLKRSLARKEFYTSILKLRVSANQFMITLTEKRIFENAHHMAVDIDRARGLMTLGSGRGDVSVFNLHTMALVGKVHAHALCVTGISFLPSNSQDSVIVASCGMDKIVTAHSLPLNNRWVRKYFLYILIVMFIVLLYWFL